MNIKLKSAILFSVLVASILLLNYLIIYALYADYREEQVYLRLEQKARSTYKLLVEVKEIDNDLLKVIDRNTINALNDEKVLIFNNKGELVYSSIDDQPVHYSKEVLERVEREKLVRFQDGENEEIGISITDNGQHGIALASAYDKVGKRKMQNLLYILLISYLAALLLTALLSYFYVKQVFRPLDLLNRQINLIGDGSLHKRVSVKDGQDELAKLAQNFNTMLDRLEVAFKVQKNFIQHASHELRTPLANLVASCESALNKKLTVEQHEKLLLSLHEEQRKLVELTNALLLLSKFESTERDADWPTIRIDAILFDAVEETQELFPEHHIHFDFASVPLNEQSVSTKGHAILLKMALSNLLRNACQYTDNKRVLIHLQMRDEQIEIAFSNHGVLLNPDETAMLFQPFFRGQNTDSRKGYGLGLAIAMRIIQLHGGQLGYRASEPESVNIFTVILGKLKV